MHRFIKLAMNNQPIPIYGKGDQTISFCYIDDNVDICIKTLHENSYVNDVLNIGNEVEISVLDLAKKIISITNSKSEIINLPSLKEGDMTRRCPDITKMKTLLGISLVSLEDGIKKMMYYYDTYTIQKA
nr:NAD-dependent epimerase/dehydratase family protein [uncultured Winogradskyella sp.]|tara:strand:+ start:6847 stop:7233 length:387 start_codon:yes stop_codon:yes gene_type:complete